MELAFGVLFNPQIRFMILTPIILGHRVVLEVSLAIERLNLIAQVILVRNRDVMLRL